jgi:hypothetical protein
VDTESYRLCKPDAQPQSYRDCDLLRASNLYRSQQRYRVPEQWRNALGLQLRLFKPICFLYGVRTPFYECSMVGQCFCLGILFWNNHSHCVANRVSDKYRLYILHGIDFCIKEYL